MKKTPLNRGKGSLKKSPLKRKVGGKKLVNKTPLKNQGSKLKQNGIQKNKSNKPRKRNLKRKQIRKQSTSSLSREIKACDLIFSKYIRLINADSEGNVRCYTCGHKAFWRQSGQQNGHFMSRSSMGTRWLRLNCAVQCVSCNSFHQGNLKVFAENLERDYGKGVVEHLDQLAKKPSKITLEKVRQLREHFEGEVIKLKQKLNL